MQIMLVLIIGTRMFILLVQTEQSLVLFQLSIMVVQRDLTLNVMAVLLLMMTVCLIGQWLMSHQSWLVRA